MLHYVPYVTLLEHEKRERLSPLSSGTKGEGMEYKLALGIEPRLPRTWHEVLLPLNYASMFLKTDL